MKKTNAKQAQEELTMILLYLSRFERNQYNDDEKFYLYDMKGHDKLNPFKFKEIEKCKHEVFIDKFSKIYDIYKKDVLNIPPQNTFFYKQGFYLLVTILF